MSKHAPETLKKTWSFAEIHAICLALGIDVLLFGPQVLYKDTLLTSDLDDNFIVGLAGQELMMSFQ